MARLDLMFLAPIPSIDQASRCMHSLRIRLSIGVVWAMVPLTLISALPRIGCICADGRYKIICDRIGSNACRPADARAAESGMCSCCHRHARSPEASAACKVVSLAKRQTPPRSAGHHACCLQVAGRRGASSAGTSNMQATDGPRCCTPVLLTPLLPPIVQADAMPIGLADLTFITVSDLPGVPLVCAGLVAEREHVLPPIDRVVVNQVFLI